MTHEAAYLKRPDDLIGFGEERGEATGEAKSNVRTANAVTELCMEMAAAREATMNKLRENMDTDRGAAPRRKTGHIRIRRNS